MRWEDISAALTEAGGESLDHTALASAAHALIAGRTENPGWWAQSIAVAYEQEIGRRVVGQTSTGDFQVSASKTLSLTPEAARDAVRGLLVADGQIAGRAFDGELRETETEVRRFIRVDLADGARIEAATTAKTGGAAGESGSALTLRATKIGSEAARDEIRAGLKAICARL